jgi:hypothetical protein
MFRMRIRRYTTVSLVGLVLAIITPISAQAITTGNCNVTVNSAMGVVLVNNGGYCYLAFSATGPNSFTIPAGITSMQILVVAGGGGGGGGAWGGGGGAGGVVFAPTYSVTSGTTLNLSVGAGGAGGGGDLAPANNRSANGADSWVNTSSSLVAVGGGGGAGYAYGSDVSLANGAAGGSGGGGTEHGSGGTGGTSTQTLPTYATAKYGNAGGNSAAGSGYVAGAGGGGAGAAGTAMTSSGVGGSGGAGTYAFANIFTAIGQFGVSGYIAGGGGGGASTTAGGGGAGGGGAGGGNTNRPGSAGVANTGSGGGGASYSPASVGGAGGSGLIIFRFAEIVLPATIGTPIISGNIYKGVSISISVSIDSAGKVSFFLDNKRIANCLKVSMSGSSPSYTATCSWKPTVQGFHLIKATVYPTNSQQSSQTSSARQVFVGKRSTTR